MSEVSELLGPGTWVQQGPATLIVREAGWVVLVPGTPKDVVEAAWTVLGEEPAGEDFLDRLAQTAALDSADKIAAILYAITDATSVTVGVKGRTPVAIYTAEGVQQVAGTDEEPFVLRTFDEVRRTAFGDLPAEESLGAPRIEAGITRIRGFVHMSVDPADLDEEARQALVDQVEADGRSIEDPQAAAKRAASPPAPAPSPAPSSSSASASSSAPQIRRPAVAGRQPGQMPPSISRGGAPPAPSGTAEPASSGPSVFDGLFSDAPPAATSAPSPAPAPAPAADRDARDPQAATPSSQAAADPAPSPVPAPAPTPEPAASPAPSPAADPAVEGDATAAGGAPERSGTPGAATEQPRPPAAGRRRLVSTSLFDRKRRPLAGTASPTTPARETAPGPDDESAPPAAGEQAPAPAAEEHVPAPATTEQAPAPASVPTPEPAPDGADLTDADDGGPVTLVAPIDDGEGPEDEVTDAVPEPSADPAGPQGRESALAPSPSPAAAAESTGSYDDLFGKTVFRRIEDAAVRRSEEDEEPHTEPEPPAAPDSAPDDGQATTTDPGPETPGPSAPVSSTEVSASIGGEFIDWVPGVGRAAPEIAHTAARRAAEPPTAGPVYPQVHMAESSPAPHPAPTPHAPAPDAGPRAPGGGHPWPTAPAGAGTVGTEGDAHRAPSSPAAGRPPTSGSSPAASEQAGAGRGHGGGPTPGPGHPTGGAVPLPGLVCANGHANPPERSECRSCRAPLRGPTRTVARPPLGAVAISTGGGFLLDRTAVVGRRPRASRVSGHDVPQLITVPSPQQDISRSHVELRLEGWHVVALDLGTTNGTTLLRPAMEPVRLRPREGVILYDGDQLDLGDGVLLQLREAV